MKIKDLLNQAQKKLKKQSFSPRLDAEILLNSILNKKRSYLLANLDQRISLKQKNTFNKLLKRRIKNEPVAYIIGEKFFYGRKFKINNKVLIPRPETETLVEKTLEYAHKNIYPSKKTLVFDLGTGSGCILLSLIKEFSKNPNFSTFEFAGTDLSSQALRIAQKNATRLEIEQVNFIKANLLDFMKNQYLKKTVNSQLIITANLPYLSKKIYKNCPKSVINFEPKKALLAENKGLDLYTKLLEQVKTKKIAQNSFSFYLIIEISPEQKILIQEKFQEILPKNEFRFSKDLAGKWRFIEILI